MAGILDRLQNVWLPRGGEAFPDYGPHGLLPRLYAAMQRSSVRSGRPAASEGSIPLGRDPSVGESNVGLLADIARQDAAAQWAAEHPVTSTLYGLASGGMPGGAAAVPARAMRKPGVISDWRWRPLREVQEGLGVSAVPDYIAGGYGKFMLDQARRAERGDLGARDLLKAYGITRSSINRTARTIDDDLISSSSSVRPEGYFSEWLLSREGKKYLDDATRGKVNAEALHDLEHRFAPFGMAKTLSKDLAYAAESIPQLSADVPRYITGPLDQYRDFSQSLSGIGPSKAGFLSSLLGRGDLPTLDARQIRVHTTTTPQEAGRYIARRGGKGGDAAVDRLAKRQAAMALDLPSELEPFRQHLTHHTVWDRVGGSTVTHDDIVRAMQQGKIDPTLLGLLGAGALGAGAYLGTRE